MGRAYDYIHFFFFSSAKYLCTSIPDVKQFIILHKFIQLLPFQPILFPILSNTAWLRAPCVSFQHMGNYSTASYCLLTSGTK